MNIDWVTLLSGFLIGTATGAAGNYFGNKYTDQRREKAEARKVRKGWDDMKSRYPKLIDEMVADLRNEAQADTRCFVVLPRHSMTGIMTEPTFAYYTEDHPLIMSAVERFLEGKLITDITKGNLPRYRMSERFVDKLLDR